MSSNPFSHLLPRVCTACNGEGKKQDGWGTKEIRNCYNCEGRCQFYAPDLEVILKAIKGRKGLRSSRPSRELGARAYYVWRMARFHGGVDVTMPVMADMELGRDPFRPELDSIADAVAKKAFGTDMAAACRWGPLLGGISESQAAEYIEKHNLPMTSDKCGPVVIGNKPASEQPELQ